MDQRLLFFSPLMLSEQRAVAFDLDGTLVDTSPDIFSALKIVLSRKGFLVADTDTLRQSTGDGPLVILRTALGCQFDTLNCIDELVSQLEIEYANQPTKDSRLMPNAHATLLRLRDLGYKLAVCSNKPQYLCEKILSELHISYLFDSIVGAQIGLRPKPAPDPLLLALKECDCKFSSAVFVGDTAVDVLTARATGCRAVQVSFGFRSPQPDEEKPDEVISDFTHLFGYLERTLHP